MKAAVLRMLAGLLFWCMHQLCKKRFFEYYTKSSTPTLKPDGAT